MGDTDVDIQCFLGHRERIIDGTSRYLSRPWQVEAAVAAAAAPAPKCAQKGDTGQSRSDYESQR